MDKIQELSDKIEEVRKLLNSLVDEKGSLTDPELAYVSELLDGLLNEYYELSNKKEGHAIFKIC